MKSKFERQNMKSNKRKVWKKMNTEGRDRKQ